MKQKHQYLWILPGVVILLLFLIFPLLSILYPTIMPDGFSLSAYGEFFANSFNRSVFWRTLKIASLVTFLAALLGLPTAYYMANCSAKVRSLLMGLVLFPLLINSVVRSFAWITILGRNGLINQLLASLHWVNEPIKLLYTESAIVIGSLYLFLPLMIITLVGVIETINPEIIEASRSLGASPIRSFWDVIFPLTLPGIIVGSILVFTGTLTAYTTPQLLGGNENMLMSTFLYQNAMTLGDWQLAGVIALLMIVVTIIVMKALNAMARQLDKRGTI
ncbi:ABC transporter permease [Facklamia hominis]|uniref:ABC transporter permease n=1 Tax=Facklamia hominis TaxID=178214 RepID=UPI00288C074A|nr:ABC transporter permease [Facklamia hominis]